MAADFPYAFDHRFIGMWKPLGARPGFDGVSLTADGTFVASFGRFRVQTPLANIDDAHITENYRWYTAIGVRLSFADDGLTFGTNAKRGVCVHFAQPIDKVIGWRPSHSALTVTVEDCAGLVAALESAGQT